MGFKMGHKQSKKLLKTTKVPLGLAGASIAGQAFGSTALQGAGATAGAFIAPAVSISMGGYVVNELRDLKGVKKKK